jgi:DNA-binding beta-propeller fold protein YncE
MIWRTNIGGFEADHMAISPDGARVLVSDTTNGVVKAFDTATGRVVGQFTGGTYTHDVDFSADGRHIYSGSIGTTVLPYSLNALKGNRQLTIADASTYQVLRTYSFDLGLRPKVLLPDESLIYFQLSYRRGFIEFDLASGTTRRTKTLPATAAGDALFPDGLPANSMHHGLAMSADGRTICAAGTIDNYVAMVDRATFATHRLVSGYAKPYWAETSRDGTKCLVSNSDGDYVAVLDYASGLEIKRVTVGDYPQRERNGRLDTTVTLASRPG